MIEAKVLICSDTLGDTLISALLDCLGDFSELVFELNYYLHDLVLDLVVSVLIYKLQARTPQLFEVLDCNPIFKQEARFASHPLENKL